MDYFRQHMIFLIVIFLFAIYESMVVLISKNTNMFHKFVAFLVILYIVYLSVHRNTFLPFLGPCVLPGALLKDATDTKLGNIRVIIEEDIPDGTKIVYWAAEPSKEVYDNPYDAYHNYKNSGVTTIKDKKAYAYIDCPGKYKVPMNRILNPHIHYRIVYPNGLVGSIKTIMVTCS
jgi:hypothetical protein